MTIQVGPYILDAYQERAIVAAREAAAAGKQRILIVAPTGYGKCLGRGTRVLMFDGSSKQVEHIVPGDLLMGPDSTPRTVVSLGSGFGPMYRITPVKGEPFTANGDHILALKFTGNSHLEYAKHKGSQFVEMSIDDYLTQSKSFKHLTKLYRVGVDFPGRAVPLDPYFVGAWIGDGSSRGPAIFKPDEEIADCVKFVASQHGCWYSKTDNDGKCPRHAIIAHRKGEKPRPNPVWSILKSMNLERNKHIPEIYKSNSRSIRLEILAGLLDTDGHMMAGGFDFINKSKSISDDVAWIARSVGLFAKVSECRKRCVNNGKWGTYFRVSISGDCSIIPTRIPRKKASKRLQVKDVLVSGFSVESIGDGEYFGFQITGDGLFLLNDFTVTHNTVISLALAKLAADKGKQLDFFATGRQLVFQARDKAEKAGLACSVWMAGEDQVNFRSPFRIISKDTFESRVDSSPWIPGDICITDEVDVAVSPAWRKIHDQYKLLIGFTATPCDGDGLALDGWDQTIIGATYSELIASGRLVDIPESKCFSWRRPDLSKADIGSNGDYATKWLVDRMNTNRLCGDVVKSWKTLGENRPTVVFAVNKAHAAALCEQFVAEGIPSRLITDETSTEDRQDAFNATDNGTNKILCSVLALSRGWDLPIVSCAVLAAPTKRLRLYLQRVGRVLRSHPTKKDAILIDHSGCIWEFGWPTEDRPWELLPGSDKDIMQLTAKARDEKQAPPERYCPMCAAMMRYSKKCPNCGYEKPIRSQMAETVDGVLVKVKKKAVKERKQQNDVQKVWMSLLARLAYTGKTYGVAAVIFHKTTGKWPEQAGVRPVAQRHQSKLMIGSLWPGFVKRKKKAV